jgi:hypothetical protein
MRLPLLAILFLLCVLPVHALCEAAGSGRCFYVDAVSGDDNNNGAESTPWRSLRNVGYFYGGYTPAGAVTLQPGDYVYLRGGIHNTTYCQATCGLDAGDRPRVLNIVGNANGAPGNPITLKSYPGETAVIESGLTSVGIYMERVSNWKIENIEVARTQQQGIIIVDFDNIELVGLHIHDVNGTMNNNVAGLTLKSGGTAVIRDSRFHDNYDRTGGGPGGIATENSANVVIFEDAKVTFYNNTLYHTLPSSESAYHAVCLKHKHGGRSLNSYFHVYNNTFANCKIYTFGTSTMNTHFHHNVIYNSVNPIVIKDLGGTPYLANFLAEYNSIYTTAGRALAFQYAASNDGTNPRNITFRNNIVYDTRSSYTLETNTVDIGPYMSDAELNIIAPEYKSSNNCYYNPNIAPRFGLGGERGGLSGGVYNLAAWQTLANNGVQLNYDTGSIVADPGFLNAGAGDLHLATNSPCAAMGAYAVQSTARQRGDTNSDGTVNLSDILLVASYLGRSSGFDSRVDERQDGVIDIFDLVLVGQHWGETS